MAPIIHMVARKRKAWTEKLARRNLQRPEAARRKKLRQLLCFRPDRGLGAQEGKTKQKGEPAVAGSPVTSKASCSRKTPIRCCNYETAQGPRPLLRARPL